VTTPTIEILVWKTGLSLNFSRRTTTRATQYKIRICAPGSAIEPTAIRIHNPTLPSTDLRLNLDKKPVRRNYFPFAVVSRPSDFFSDFYYSKFINI